MILTYVPDLNLQSIIPNYNKRWNEKYLWALHSITYQQLRNKSGFNSYANLDSELLRKYLGTRYTTAILTQLLNAKIIEPFVNSKGVQSYSKGAFSKAYRIRPEIMENTRIKATPIKKLTYVRKITNVRSQLIKEAVKLNPNLQHELLMLTHRRIKYREAFEYIKQTYEAHTPQYKARVIALNEFNEMHKANFSMGKELLPFHFSYVKGRVYSPASMLPRDLERFTYFVGYENERSICLDMPNSQLCFFDELVKRSVFKDKHASKSIGESDTREKYTKKVHYIGREEREIEREREERPFNPKNNEILPLSHSYSLCRALSPNQKQWKDYIYQGLGYEIMMKTHSWKDKSENHTKQERQEFKEIFFGQLFYNRYIPNYLTPLEQTFQKHFPIEAISLRTIKKQLGNKLLAVQVQTLEGKFFHDICVNYIKSKYKNVPFTIKHDSITLPQVEASYLIDELNKLVKDFFKTNELKFKIEQL
jgi:hypothetical protein